MNKTIRLSVYTAILLGGLGCADLNIEVQQTSRINSSAARNPTTLDSNMQGSSRTQGKSPVGIKAKSSIANDTSKSIGSDVSGPEK